MKNTTLKVVSFLIGFIIISTLVSFLEGTFQETFLLNLTRSFSVLAGTIVFMPLAFFVEILLVAFLIIIDVKKYKIYSPKGIIFYYGILIPFIVTITPLIYWRIYFPNGM